MATKKITIAEHFPKHSLLELVGILNHKEVEELREQIRERRKASRHRLEKLHYRLEESYYTSSARQ